ncbi:hypothetical protein [Mucilaginibacter celer]|uniref:VCBS repeat-containing protein n=1 Tax=Mucilaginibacter celer TaxID=2305508 RepID=A0A494VR32_9SPHI|nr:hypothetical protein [Mucilaginibacter celer]AYL96491.1 hypothetical protein HYN43_014810 [Mucilaginibacter celer]
MKTFLITTILFIYTNLLFAQHNTFKTASAWVDGVLYSISYSNSDTVVEVKAKRRIVSRLHEFGIWEMKFIDFNKDGYKDILIQYVSNTPNDNNLYLYNKHRHNFIEVNNFRNFAYAAGLGSNNLYYSYERAGCGDLNWNSYLFKIVNFQAIPIGFISGLGCNGDEKMGIFIFKINRTKEKLIREYPIDKIDKYKSYKWGFIKQYWKTNYRKFL